MSMVNDYLMFRLLMEQNEARKGQRRQSVQYLPTQPRGSIFVPRTSISDGEPRKLLTRSRTLSFLDGLR